MKIPHYGMAGATALLLAVSSSKAATGTDVWLGNFDANWNSAANWSPAVNAPPASGDSLVFGATGSSGSVLTNNISNLTLGASNTNGIIFNSGASAFTLYGNQISLSGNVTNSSTASQAINFNINGNGGNSPVFFLTTGGGNIIYNGVFSGMAASDAMKTAGAGVFYLANPANTFAGALQINSGTTINVNTVSNLGVNCSLGSHTAANESALVGIWLRGGTLQYTNSFPQSTDRTVRLLNGVTSSIDASGSPATATLAFLNSTPTNFFESGGTRTLALTGSNTGTNTFNIQIVNQSANATSLTKNGAGTWIVSGNNTYSGQTLLNQGTLAAGSSAAFGSGQFFFANNNNAMAMQAGANGLTLANPIFINQNNERATIDPQSFNFTVSGSISNNASGTENSQSLNIGVSSVTTGTVFITSTNNQYTGRTYINGGVLNVAHLAIYGNASSIGTRSFTFDTNSPQVMGLVLQGGGTLQYTAQNGPQITDRMIRLGTVGGIDASGATAADTLYFSAPASTNLFAAGGNRTLTLTGSNSGTNTFNSRLEDGAGGSSSLLKSGTGVWIYSGNNNNNSGGGLTFTGGFTVSNGTLIVTGNNAARSGATTVATNSTLQLQANAGNINSSGVCVAIGTNSTLMTLGNNALVQLRSDSSVTFASPLTGVGSAVNFNVNQLAAGVAQTLSFAPSGFSSGASFGGNFIVNVTGGNNYTLQLGPVAVNNNNSLIFNTTNANLTIGALSNGTAGGLTKNGPGTLTLSSSNNYQGLTVVNGGTLQVNNTTGSGTGPNAVTVNSGATLGGNGFISGVVTVNGTLSPGNSGIGTLTVSNSPGLNGTMWMEINKTNIQTADNLLVIAPLNFNGALTVSNTGPALTGGEVFTLFMASSYAGSFSTTNLPALGAGLNWWLNNLIVNGSITVNRAPAAVNMTVSRNAGVNALKVAISDLATNWSDADGDTVSFIGVGTSTNGASLSVNGGYIFCNSAANVNDQFNYTISDGRGGITVGLVNVVVNPFVTGQNASVNVSGSSATVGFAGIPGYSYGVQRSTNLTDWVTLETTNAPLSGLFNFIDSFGDLGFVPTSAYYRLQFNP